MMATLKKTYIPTAALSSTQRGGERMPSAMPAAMCMCASAFTGILIWQTGVITSVSLFVLNIVPLLLVVGLVVLISLLLICLTGLITLESLVGPEVERTVRTARGD